jgi:hypothetical protein
MKISAQDEYGLRILLQIARANSEEGMEKGTCLNIWKLRKKKWYITASAFARIPNMIKPTLKTASGTRN